MADLADIRERLATIETSQKYVERMIAEALTDMRPRVSRLERRQWVSIGGVGAISFALAKFGIPIPFLK